MTTAILQETRGLAASEETIERAQQTGRDAVLVIGRELARIRRERWYQQTHRTFDEYCHGRWGFSGSRGTQLADAYQVCRNIAGKTYDDESQADLHARSLHANKTSSDPNAAPAAFEAFYANFRESHARELKKLPAEDQAAAWDTATKISGGAPNDLAVAEAVKAHQNRFPLLEERSREEQMAAIQRAEQEAELECARYKNATLAWKVGEKCRRTKNLIVEVEDRRFEEVRGLLAKVVELCGEIKQHNSDDETSEE